MVLVSLYWPEHLSLDPAQSAQAAAFRLADHVLCHHCGAAFLAYRALALLAKSDLQPGKPEFVGRSGDLRNLGHGDWHGAEDLQQRPNSDQARGAGAFAASCPYGGPAKPDQSTFPVQHAQFRFLAGTLRS